MIKPMFYIPVIRFNIDQFFIKTILDSFQWGTIQSIKIVENENNNSAIITYNEWNNSLTHIYNILYHQNQLKINYSPFKFWWFKNHIPTSDKVPKQLIFTDLPNVINVCLDPDYDSESESDSD